MKIAYYAFLCALHFCLLLKATFSLTTEMLILENSHLHSQVLLFTTLRRRKKKSFFLRRRRKGGVAEFYGYTTTVE